MAQCSCIVEWLDLATQHFVIIELTSIPLGSVNASTLLGWLSLEDKGDSSLARASQGMLGGPLP